MKDKKLIIITLISLSFPLGATLLNAQEMINTTNVLNQNNQVEEDILSLKKAKQIALSENPGFQAAMTRIDQAAAIAQQAKSTWSPSVEVYGSAYRMEGVPGSQGAFGSFNNYKAGVDVSWLIFDGLSRRYRIMAAKYGEDISENSTLDAQRLLLQGVSTAYLSAMLAEEQRLIALETAKLNEILYKETYERNLAGAASRADVMNFKMRKIASENLALSAELAARRAKIALATLMGVDDAVMTKQLQAISVVENEFQMSSDDFKEEIRYAMSNRPDLIQKELEIEQAEAAVKVEKGSYMPNIVATGRYGYNHAADNDTLDPDENDEINVGVAASWDLFDGGLRRGKVGAVKADAVAAEALYRQTRIEVAAEIRDALASLDIQNQALKKSEEIYKLSAEIQDIVTEEYNASLVSVTRLNQAQTDATSAETTWAKERISRILAIENLNAATGKILEQ